MLKRIMASLGKGTASVNLKLNKGQYRAGETVKGTMAVEGGSVDQEIKIISVDVVLSTRIGQERQSKIIQTVDIARKINIRAYESLEIPFEYSLPVDCPVSRGGVQYRLATRMDLIRSLDAFDSDVFIVLPGKDRAMVMKALGILEFREKFDSGEIGRNGQEFHYYPTRALLGQLVELVLIFSIGEQDIKLLMELILCGPGMNEGCSHHAEMIVPGTLIDGDSVSELADRIMEFLVNEINRAQVRKKQGV